MTFNTVSLQSSATPERGPGGEAFGPEPLLQPLLTDTFDSGALYFWTLGAGWNLIASEGGQALANPAGDEPVTFVHNTLTDLAVQVRVRFESGMFRLSLRQSEAGAYTALLSADGQVALYRGTSVLGVALVALNQPGQWRTLRLSAIGDILRVQVDGVEIMAVQDAAPLPQGTFSFAGVGASGGGGVTVDDVAVGWIAPVATPTATLALIPTMTPSPFISSAMSENERLSGGMTALSIQNCASAGIVFKYISDVPGLLSAVAEGSVLGQTRCYVIMMQPGIYNLTTVVSDFSLMPFKDGNVTIIGIDSYQLGTHPSVLPDTSRVIIQRDPNASQSDLGLIQTGAIVTFYNVILRNGGGTSRWAGGGLVNRGTLNLYNAVLQDNTALGYGGGLYNEGSAHIVNTIFQNNRISFVGTGGGAIANDDGTILAECVIFNGNQAVGAGGAIYNFGIGSMTFNQTGFINNLTSNPQGKAINSAATTNLNGTINWQPTSDPATVQFTGTGYTPAISSLTNGSAVNLNCSVPAIPTPNPAPVLNIPPETTAFHALNQVGLPRAFSSLPYDINARGDQPPDPLYVTSNQPAASQGYGPSSFSYVDYQYTAEEGTKASLYSGTFQIHPGLDYGVGQFDGWTRRVILSVCDGVVIQGRGAINSQNPPSFYNLRDNGGSANPGRGVSVRCFMDSLDSGRADTDNDGLPNLSNIVVVYNHLIWDPTLFNPDTNVEDSPQQNYPIRGPYTIDCSYIIPAPGCTGVVYQLPRFRYPSPNVDVVAVNDLRVGDVVRVGTVLGQTGPRSQNGPDHLHMEIWLARGYLKSIQAGNSEADNSINFNPYLMYTSDVLGLHGLQTYFPRDYNGQYPTIDSFGVQDGNLNFWSLGGLNFVVGSSSKFYTNLRNSPIQGVEWAGSMYRLVSVQPFATSDLVGVLQNRYAQQPYVSINCRIGMDNVPGRFPQQMETATCTMPDLQNHNF